MSKTAIRAAYSPLLSDQKRLQFVGGWIGFVRESAVFCYPSKESYDKYINLKSEGKIRE